ncbi:Regulator of RpoS [Vibrio stylophorae]|uniref:Regulator of RpoS n=1 Tax=Vibrio stylophorae TaxID=659351 RepID=A0ABM8ZUP0_9VIBR|nr:response regulator [Vibrio stylophorae]CAH0533904.1 Regulator of RpoS [Vibrio stylophorae]
MLTSKSVLVVEDDPVFRHILVSYLESLGMVVRAVEDGLEALVALRESVPDLMFCDLNLPMISGMEVMEEALRDYAKLPIVVISGTGGMGEVAQAMRLGVKDYLVKPIRDLNQIENLMIPLLVHAKRDFSGRYLSEQGEIDEESAQEHEFAEHIERLAQHPEAARELLLSLMPHPESVGQASTETTGKQWQLKYFVLQPSDRLPILLDYTWLDDGRLGFYVVDTNSAEKNNTAMSLLVRALFNDYLRTRAQRERNLLNLVQHIESGLKKVNYSAPIRALFANFDPSNFTLDMVTSGMGFSLTTCDGVYQVESGEWLGEGKHQLRHYMLPASGGRISLSQIGVSSFSLSLQPVS